MPVPMVYIETKDTANASKTLVSMDGANQLLLGCGPGLVNTCFASYIVGGFQVTIMNNLLCWVRLLPTGVFESAGFQTFVVRPQTPTADALPANMNVTGAAPFATATGANRVPGDVIVETMSPTNGGTTRGRVVLKVAGNERIVVDEDSAGNGRLRVNIQTAATATAGGTVVPVRAAGFLVVNINGTNRKIPFYAT